MHLAAAYPNSINKKNLSNIGYKILGKQIVYSAVHPIVYKIEENILKVGTILLLSIMTMACKIFAMFTISMGTLFVKRLDSNIELKSSNNTYLKIIEIFN